MGLTHRDLLPSELTLLGTIDRAEHIDGHYVVEGGSLRLVPEPVEAAGWNPTQVDAYVRRLTELRAAGGVVIGAFDGTRLVAVGSLGWADIPGRPGTKQLDLLHVDAEHRHRGIGRGVVDRLASRARERGATALYISATPTRNTVDAYRHMGAVLADPPDPALLALEPEDVHLVLDL